MTEPTPGELMRRLQDNTAYLDRIAAQLQADRDRADLRYVPRVEWVEARKGISERIGDVAGDVAELKTNSEDDRKFRRQTMVLMLLAVFSAVLSAAVTFTIFFLGGPT